MIEIKNNETNENAILIAGINNNRRDRNSNNNGQLYGRSFFDWRLRQLENHRNELNYETEREWRTRKIMHDCDYLSLFLSSNGKNEFIIDFKFSRRRQDDHIKRKNIICHCHGLFGTNTIEN